MHVWTLRILHCLMISSTTVPIQRILQKSWHLKFHDLHLITKHQRCEMTVINTTRTGWLVTCGQRAAQYKNHVFDCVYVVEERAKMEQHGYTKYTISHKNVWMLQMYWWQTILNHQKIIINIFLQFICLVIRSLLNAEY